MLNFNWQVCSIEQAKKLKELGILNPSDSYVWFPSESGSVLGIKTSPDLWVTTENYPHSFTTECIPAFTLSEIAVMLGYSFVSSNVKEAADKLIEELGNGSTTAVDANARLKEANGIIN